MSVKTLFIILIFMRLTAMGCGLYLTSIGGSLGILGGVIIIAVCAQLYDDLTNYNPF